MASLLVQMMLPTLSNQAALAVLRVQGELVQINGVATTAVVVRNRRSDRFGQVSRFQLSPDMAVLKVSGEPDAFRNAQVSFDGKDWLVSDAEPSSFGLCELLVRVQA